MVTRKKHTQSRRKNKKCGGTKTQSNYHMKPKHHTKKNHPMTKKHHTKMPIVYGRIYANWCGHCVSMGPDWKKLTGLMNQRHYHVKNNDIEETEKNTKMPQFKQMYGTELVVNGYPTIFKLYKKGDLIEYYEGPRTKDAIYKWLISDPVITKNSVHVPVKSNTPFFNF
jgi:thiol-disulfide isomerase/thioredoxin